MDSESRFQLAQSVFMMSWSSVGRFVFLAPHPPWMFFSETRTSSRMFWSRDNEADSLVHESTRRLHRTSTPTKDFSLSPPPCFIFVSLFIFSYDAESQCRETLNMILMSANRCFISVCCRDFVKGKKKIKYYNHLLLPLGLVCAFVVCVCVYARVCVGTVPIQCEYRPLVQS